MSKQAPSSAEEAALRSSNPTEWEQYVASRSRRSFAQWCKEVDGTPSTWTVHGSQGRDAGGCTADGCHVDLEGMARTTQDRETLRQIAALGGRFDHEMK